MTHDPSDDVVAQQYERYRYPQPIEDLSAWLEHNWQWFDPSHAQRVLWPERAYQTNMDILIAGCGTNQAAVFAYTNPQAKVVAIDVSRASLDHEQHLKEKYGLWNLELRLLPIEDIATLGRDFDLIVSTGVLHHLAEPEVGMRALGACLRRDGVLAVMLYARYGRVGVEWLQSVCRDLALVQNESSVSLVREILTMLPGNHPVRAYLGLESNLQSDAVLVDTFLHGRERSYRVDDCLALVARSGLVFQGWLNKAPYYPHDVTGSVRRVLQTLAEPALWSVMERLYATNGCHFFMACHTERPETAYRIDFSTPGCVDDVPMFRMRCGFDGNAIFRPDWRMALNDTQVPFVRLIDGERSMREIVAQVADVTAPQADMNDLLAFARRLYQSLWRLDFLAVARNRETVPASLPVM